jgi:uncharacterized protein YpmS
MTISLKNKLLLVLAILSLAAAALACNLPGGQAEPTPTPIPISTQAVGDMATQVVAAATQIAAGGPVTLEFTEQQLTSAAALELQSQNEYDVRNIQVGLRDGLIHITGQVSRSGFDLPLKVSMRVTPNAQGQPVAEVVEATVGPLPLPDSLTGQLTERFNEIMRAELNTNGRAILVDSITIADGKMTIQAHTQ